jgi:hypothetical protein
VVLTGLSKVVAEKEKAGRRKEERRTAAMMAMVGFMV